jgi:hypothetical protein
MKKILVSLLFALLILPAVLAINLDIKKISSDDVMIAEIKNPAVIDLEITNGGSSDSFLFYNLLGFIISPKESVRIESGETKNVQLIIYPREKFDVRGLYTFTYFIRASDSSEQSDQIILKVIDLENAFEIGSEEVNPGSNSMKIYVKNKVNFNFNKIEAEFSSLFFDFEDEFSLAPLEKKIFEVQLKKDDVRKLMAGFYVMEAELKVDSEKINVEGTVNFVEKDILTTSKKDYGLIISTQIIEKKNEGNVLTPTETVIKKSIISRLFTNFSPEPDIVERAGANVYYTWARQLEPGETLEIVVKTNWLFPLLLVVLVVIIVAIVKIFTSTNLVLSKKVNFMRSKGGEFALRVSIFVKAKKNVENVTIVDRLPPLVKLFDKFGVEKPKIIDEKNRKIQWDYDKLDAGETRFITYVIYSKVGVLGKFALPSAAAIYERDGKVQEAQSNRAFFVAEQKFGPDKDEK